MSVNPTDDWAVVLAQDMHLEPQQTRAAKVSLNRGSLTTEVGVVTPTKSFMTSEQCDFMEGYWTGESAFNVPITNWGNELIVLRSGHSRVDIVTVVDKEDAFWDEDETPMVASVDPADLSVREKQLEAQLDIGKQCSTEQKAPLLQLLKQKQGAFALSDGEQVQTDIVEHSIEMDNSIRFPQEHCRMLYEMSWSRSYRN